MPGPPDDVPDIALAYALWDSENTPVPTDVGVVAEHLARARSLRRWLRAHGYDLKPLVDADQGSPTGKEQI